MKKPGIINLLTAFFERANVCGIGFNHPLGLKSFLENWSPKEEIQDQLLLENLRQRIIKHPKYWAKIRPFLVVRNRQLYINLNIKFK